MGRKSPIFSFSIDKANAICLFTVCTLSPSFSAISLACSPSTLLIMKISFLLGGIPSITLAAIDSISFKQ